MHERSDFGNDVLMKSRYDDDDVVTTSLTLLTEAYRWNGGGGGDCEVDCGETSAAANVCECERRNDDGGQGDNWTLEGDDDHAGIENHPSVQYPRSAVSHGHVLKRYPFAFVAVLRRLHHIFYFYHPFIVFFCYSVNAFPVKCGTFTCAMKIRNVG